MVHKLGQPMALSECRKVMSGPLFGDGSFDKATAETASDDYQADTIAKSYLTIGNPAVVVPSRKDWSHDAGVSDWNVHNDKAGYADVVACGEQSPSLPSNRHV